MERRILEAITEPIYPHQINDPGALCTVLEEQKGKSLDEEEALVQVVISFFLLCLACHPTEDNTVCPDIQHH